MQKLLRFVEGYFARADGTLHIFTQAGNQFVAIILHIGEDLANGVSLDDAVEIDGPVFVDGHMHGISVAEEVVEIAENFLVRPQQESAEVVRLTGGKGM